MADEEGLIYGFIIVVVIGMVGAYFIVNSTDIRNFENKFYCEETEIAGKTFKRCLKAVEVEGVK